jgi:hypothetical protein
MTLPLLLRYKYALKPPTVKSGVLAGDQFPRSLSWCLRVSPRFNGD